MDLGARKKSTRNFVTRMIARYRSATYSDRLGTSPVVRRKKRKTISTNRSIDSDETVGYSGLFTRFRVSRRKREIPRLLTFTSAVDFPKYAKNSTTERSCGVERRPAAFLRTQHDAVTSNREWNCFQPSIYDIRIESACTVLVDRVFPREAFPTSRTR